MAYFRHTVGLHFPRHETMEKPMSRLHILAVVGVTMIGTAGISFAQTQSMSQPSGVQSSVNSPSVPSTASPSTASPSAATAAPSARDQKRAERKSQRMAARGDCRAQAKQQSLAGEGRKNFIKNCVNSSHPAQ
jgi:hypothetical protein